MLEPELSFVPHQHSCFSFCLFFKGKAYLPGDVLQTYFGLFHLPATIFCAGM